jgi:hypothetical protein
MGRRPRVKDCADPACPATFTGRGLYCEWHRAGRDKPGSKFRKERNREAQQRRRDSDLRRQYPLGPRTASSPRDMTPSTGVSSPLHITAGQRLTKVGHSGLSPIPIDVTGTPGMTVSQAIGIFMAEWAQYVGSR